MNSSVIRRRGYKRSNQSETYPEWIPSDNVIATGKTVISFSNSSPFSLSNLTGSTVYRIPVYTTGTYVIEGCSHGSRATSYAVYGVLNNTTITGTSFGEVGNTNKCALTIESLDSDKFVYVGLIQNAQVTITLTRDDSETVLFDDVI